MGALRNSSRVPVQFWQDEYDHVLPASYYVEPVRRNLPAVEFHKVAGADHFDFLPPCLKPDEAPNVCTCRPRL